MGQDSAGQKVGDSRDVTNVNPWTNQMFAQEGEQQNMLRSLIFGNGASGGMFQQMQDNPMGMFMNTAPDLQRLALSGTTPFGQAQMSMADALAPQIAESVAAQYGGPTNAFYSGAAIDASARGIGDVYNQALTNITGAQNQMLSGLYGQAMPGLFGMQQNLLGTGAGMLDASMNRTAQASMPEWWQPSYLQGSGGMNFNMGNALGAGMSGAATGAAIGTPFAMTGPGAAIGGGIGFLGGGLWG